ncbi:tripartite motif containing 35-1 [Sinocyclocheilus anshuiensis]|uniref:tripartite motif containing 35-1 n=1 Tax=Sinocyclocheilus anshuiensis TaxID=1608454 RepID=UPI0007B91680|nr:PREDICTED: tripartite motif-containing protein 35-like [Sinocyclocheilus anshuiensis]
MALEDELSCPVCTELFRDPVLLSCGHSFCRQCINAHWTSSSSRNCPVCRQVSPQEPVSNLSLRNTCESYLREKNKKEEKDGEHECLIHGEKIELFCQTDEEAICATCKEHEHRWHQTQKLQQAVRQRKGKLKAALRSAEKSLVSLKKGTARDPKISRYIQVETLHQFLRKEEESRIAALNEEEKEKRGKMERIIQGGILSLSDRVKELEEGIEDDDITFLQNYHGIMDRTDYTLPDQELSSETLIDVPKHLGNLKYQAWEKMKDICSYYPVILNSNAAPPDISVSDDLTSVTSCVHQQDEPNPLHLHRNRMVLGSVGYADGVHAWDIEVGDSHHWSLGVCFGLEGKPTTQPLTPENGFWGLRRDGDSYELMTAGMSRLNTSLNPVVVRVKLVYCYECLQDTMQLKRWRKVSFSDPSSDSLIAEFARVPLEKKLFPFVIPEDQAVPLRFVPANVTLTVEQKISLLERNRVPFLFVCFGFFMFILMTLLGKSDQQGR